MIELYASYFDSSIRDLLAVCPWFVEGATCIISAIDSNPKVSSTDIQHLQGAAILGNDVIVPASTVLHTAEELFNGFDEFFVVQSEPMVYPEELSIKEIYTTERVQLDGPIPAALEAKFRAYGALRFAADGDGLNVITTNEAELAEIFRALDD